MRRLMVFLIPLLALILSACSGTPEQTSPTQTNAKGPARVDQTASPEPQDSQATLPTSPTAESNQQSGMQDLTQIDEQGAVIVEVTPVTLSDPGETLDFDVTMDTHSVDLSMDLTTLSELKTDTGLTIHPVSWDGMSGGHHVSGKLVFPSQVDGQSVLDGAKTLTLVIQNVDAPERSFTWEIDS